MGEIIQRRKVAELSDEELKALVKWRYEEDVEGVKKMYISSEKHRIKELKDAAECKRHAMVLLGIEEDPINPMLNKVNPLLMGDPTKKINDKDYFIVQELYEHFQKLVGMVVGVGIQSLQHVRLRKKYLNAFRDQLRSEFIPWMKRIRGISDLAQKEKEAKSMIQELVETKQTLVTEFIDKADASVQQAAFLRKYDKSKTFEEHVQSSKSKLAAAKGDKPGEGFNKEFEELEDSLKFRVYEDILNSSGVSVVLKTTAKICRFLGATVVFLQVVISLANVLLADDEVKQLLIEISKFGAGYFVGSFVEKGIAYLLEKFAVGFTPVGAVFILITAIVMGYNIGSYLGDEIEKFINFASTDPRGN